MSSARRRSLRNRLWTQNGRKCFWCDKPIQFKESTIEHLMPLSKGGTGEKSNLTIACQPCNSFRGNNTSLTAEQVRNRVRISSKQARAALAAQSAKEKT